MTMESVGTRRMILSLTKEIERCAYVLSPGCQRSQAMESRTVR